MQKYNLGTILLSNRINGTKIDKIDKKLRPKSLNEAYKVQFEIHKELEKTKLGIRTGWKIGCTTDVMQNYLGIHTPCVGGIFEGAVYKGAAKVPFSNYVRPGVECELAVKISEDTNIGFSSYTAETISKHVDSIAEAIEIVDDRWEDYSSIDTNSLIADDFFAAGIVLGEFFERDLVNPKILHGNMVINDEIIGEGMGSDIMQDPYNALAWIANWLSSNNQNLKQGEIIMLGSIVQSQWVSYGDKVEVEIEKLGKTSVTFF